MLTRRKFFKGLLATVGAAALVKNGIVRPEQVIAEPGPWTIDMAANTWRQERYNTIGTLLGEIPPLPGAWPMTVGTYTSSWRGATISMPLSALANPLPNIGDLISVTLPLGKTVLLGYAVHIDQVGNECVILLRDWIL